MGIMRKEPRIRMPERWNATLVLQTCNGLWHCILRMWHMHPGSFSIPCRKHTTTAFPDGSQGPGRGGPGGRPAHRQSLWAGRQYFSPGPEVAATACKILYMRILHFTIRALTRKAANAFPMQVGCRFAEVHVGSCKHEICSFDRVAIGNIV